VARHIASHAVTVTGCDTVLRASRHIRPPIRGGGNVTRDTTEGEGLEGHRWSRVRVSNRNQQNINAANEARLSCRDLVNSTQPTSRAAQPRCSFWRLIRPMTAGRSAPTHQQPSLPLLFRSLLVTMRNRPHLLGFVSRSGVRTALWEDHGKIGNHLRARCYLTFNTLSAKDAREATVGETRHGMEVAECLKRARKEAGWGWVAPKPIARRISDLISLFRGPVFKILGGPAVKMFDRAQKRPPRLSRGSVARCAAWPLYGLPACGLTSGHF
jgi:hypothetical protein